MKTHPPSNLADATSEIVKPCPLYKSEPLMLRVLERRKSRQKQNLALAFLSIARQNTIHHSLIAIYQKTNPKKGQVSSLGSSRPPPPLSPTGIVCSSQRTFTQAGRRIRKKKHATFPGMHPPFPPKKNESAPPHDDARRRHPSPPLEEPTRAVSTTKQEIAVQYRAGRCTFKTHRRNPHGRCLPPTADVHRHVEQTRPPKGYMYGAPGPYLLLLQGCCATEKCEQEARTVYRKKKRCITIQSVPLKRLLLPAV